MARITFEYDPADPGNVGVDFDLDIADEETFDAETLVEILATGVDGVVVSCWEDNDEREHVILGVAKLLLLANDARRNDDNE